MGKIILKSSDNKVFEVEEIVARESNTINIMIEPDSADDSALPLPNVPSETLAKVIEFCERHTDVERSSEEELKKFDDEFLDLNQNVLLDLIMAANYLGIKKLFDLTCRKVADMIRGKSPDEIRQTFNLDQEDNGLLGLLEWVGTRVNTDM